MRGSEACKARRGSQVCEAEIPTKPNKKANRKLPKQTVG